MLTLVDANGFDLSSHSSDVVRSTVICFPFVVPIEVCPFTLFQKMDVSEDEGMEL